MQDAGLRRSRNWAHTLVEERATTKDQAQKLDVWIETYLKASRRSMWIVTVDLNCLSWYWYDVTAPLLLSCRGCPRAGCTWLDYVAHGWTMLEDGVSTHVPKNGPKHPKGPSDLARNHKSLEEPVDQDQDHCSFLQAVWVVTAHDSIYMPIILLAELIVAFSRPDTYHPCIKCYLWVVTASCLVRAGLTIGVLE